MINDLINYLKGKKVLILGFGREGKSTYKVIRKYLPEQELYISDQNPKITRNIEELKEDNYVNVLKCEEFLKDLNDYDVIMKSPGVSFVGVDLTGLENKIKSQLELFLEFFNVFTIGVTGTKGKSTTSSLIYSIIKDQGESVQLLGNIGIPVFDCLDTVEEGSKIVLEMSSHQLEFMKHSPNISILLNISEEHLDHYNSYDEYIEAKCKIFRSQIESDVLIYNFDDEMLNKFVHDNKGKTYKLSFSNRENSDINKKGDIIYFENEALYNVNEERNLVGDYNLNNIMFALTVAKLLNFDMKKAAKSVAEFKTLSHRLEFVGKYNDILFYDNSIATVPIATMEAIKALKIVDTLIIGGMDRGIDYSEFIEYLKTSSVNHIICMPKTGHDIADKLNDNRTVKVETLEEAVDVSKKLTEKNKICLLSPTAASYGFFKNFEEKGDLFQKFVKN